MSGGHGNLPLILRVYDHRSTVAVEACGLVDFTTAPLLRSVLSDLVDDHRSVVLDLAEVSLLDGHSVGMLVASARRAGQCGHTLRTRNATGRVLRVMEVTGVAKLLEEPAEQAEFGGRRACRPASRAPPCRPRR